MLNHLCILQCYLTLQLWQHPSCVLQPTNKKGKARTKISFPAGYVIALHFASLQHTRVQRQVSNLEKRRFLPENDSWFLFNKRVVALCNAASSVTSIEEKMFLTLRPFAKCSKKNERYVMWKSNIFFWSWQQSVQQTLSFYVEFDHWGRH